MHVADLDELKAALAPYGIDVASIASVAGGDISAAFRIEAGDGRRLFVKLGGPEMLAAESIGLETLSEASHTLVVPRPTAYCPAGKGRSYLVLEWLERHEATDDHWLSLGRGLAQLHRNYGDQYGFHQDNFIGRLPQQNSLCDSWSDFFLTRRLEPQTKIAREAGSWESSWTPLFENLKDRLADLIPAHPPASLVHGDLWSGNALASAAGPAILDPAVYYGDREVDIAMTELFGGFSPAFYSAYREAYPLDRGYKRRRDLYNLYHLLNHLNHFGSSYAGSVDRILKDLVG